MVPKPTLSFAALDWDLGTQSYDLIVHVKDTGNTHTATVSVAVAVNPINEATPSFSSNPTLTPPENSPVPTDLVTYAADDSDASPHDVVLYEMVSGKGTLDTGS